MFRTNPGLVPIVERPDLWWLDGPLVWDDGATVITIPTFFISDDASIPKILDAIPFLDRQGLSRRPGLLHDGVYSLGRERGKDYADDLLRRACIAEGMPRWQADIYYRAVHYFGASSWADDAREATFGRVVSGDFYSKMGYDEWVKSGATIFSKPV